MVVENEKLLRAVRVTLVMLGLSGLVACGDSTDDGVITTATDTGSSNEVVVDVQADTPTGDVDAIAPSDGGSADGQSDSDTGNPSSGGCATIVTVLDQEPVVVTGGVSDELSVFIPENAVSVTVSVVGAIEDSLLYSLGSWVNPSGVLVPSGWGSDGQNGGGLCLTCSLRLAAIQGAFAALAPNNPNATFESGEHRLSVIAQNPPQGFFGGTPTPADDEVYVTVQAKVVQGGLPDTGTLNINLHFTGAQGWTADGAPTNPDVQATLDKVRDIYAQVGITVGTVTYQDISNEFQVIEDFDGPNADLMRMFSTSDMHDNHALNLFFVDELLGPFGGTIGLVLGISGGIPGPPGLHGTPRSGVAIAIKPVPQAPAAIDTTMAHEMGHFLGLFHTIEANPFGFGPTLSDPLPDTPETDDTSWLMHNQGAGTQLSPWQGIVMRSNPLVCH